MEISSNAGLTVTFDDETGIFTFDWDENTHPEYNFIKDFTDQDFATMMRDYLELNTPDDSDPEAASCPAQV